MNGPETDVRQYVELITQQYADNFPNLRYERFMADETPEDWVQLLGPDVSGLTHGGV